MNRYVLTNFVIAEETTRAEYCKSKGWALPADENPLEVVMRLTYSDGTVTMMEKDRFIESATPTDNLISQKFDFGTALELAQQGMKIAREGWNGKNMFVVYQKGYPDGIPCNKQTAEAWGMKEGDLFICEPYLQMKTATGSHVMWSPSMLDFLANDWMIIE